MTARRGRFGFLVFHGVLIALFLVAGWRQAAYRQYSLDELLNLLTARQLAARGTVWFPAAEIETNPALRELFSHRDLVVRAANGDGAAKYGVANLVVPALLLAVHPALGVVANLVPLLVILYLLRRLTRDHGFEEWRYQLAALFVIFGSTLAAYWHSWFPFPFVAALLLVEIHYFERFGRDRRGADLLLAALGFTALVLTRPEAVTYGLLPFAVGLWSRRRDGALPRRRVALALGIALLVAVGTTLAFNHLKTGNWFDSGEGTYRWSLRGIWLVLTHWNENIFLMNLPLLLVFIEWRRVRQYLSAAVTAAGLWLLYACWYGWDGAAGYSQRLHQPAVLLLGLGLLFTARPKLALLLFLISFLFNSAWFFIPYFDLFYHYDWLTADQTLVADHFGPRRGSEQVAGLELLVQLVRGAWAGGRP